MILRAMRILGALALLAVGAVHLQQYGSAYDQINTIGPLFLLNGIASAMVGVGLLLPLDRWLASRRSEAVSGLLAAGGVLIAVGSLIALFISETSTLFGFSEAGYSTAIVVAIVAEAAALLLLAPVAVACAVRLREATRRARIGSRPGRTLRAV